MWTYPRRRRRCYRIITTSFFFFFFLFLFWVLPIRAEERGELVVTDGEVQKKTTTLLIRKFPEDVSGTLKGMWHASSSKSSSTPLREISNKRHYTSGSKGVFQLQMRQQKNESKNSCFWVEGDLLLRTTSSPVMHVNFAGVYLNATGIVHAHGQSRNLEHVSLENSNEQRFYQSVFREALRTSASDLAW